MGPVARRMAFADEATRLLARSRFTGIPPASASPAPAGLEQATACPSSTRAGAAQRPASACGQIPVAGVGGKSARSWSPCPGNWPPPSTPSGAVIRENARRKVLTTGVSKMVRCMEGARKTPEQGRRKATETFRHICRKNQEPSVKMSTLRMFAINRATHRPRLRGGKPAPRRVQGAMWDNPTPQGRRPGPPPRPPFPYPQPVPPHASLAHVRRPDDGLDRPPLPLLSPPADPAHPAVHRNGERRRHHPRGHRAPPAASMPKSTPVVLPRAAANPPTWPRPQAGCPGGDEINLNCGLPQRPRAARSLWRQPDEGAQLAADCVKAMRDVVDVPVTVKHRIGIDKEESYSFVRDFVAPWRMQAAPCSSCTRAMPGCRA